MADTKTNEYTEYLLKREAWWKQLLDVQMPYRINLQRLNLGFVLDIGCGIGRNLINLGGSSRGVGVDHNPSSVAIAQSRGLIALTPEEFSNSSYAKPSAYDSFLLSHVAEHMRREDVVSLLREHMIYLRAGGRVVLITPQEAGYRSDPTHVEFMDFKALESILEETELRLLREYSFPLPRVFGRVFKYNEFVTIGQKIE